MKERFSRRVFLIKAVEIGAALGLLKHLSGCAPSGTRVPTETVKPPDPTATLKPPDPTETVKPPDPTATLKPPDPTATLKPPDPTKTKGPEIGAPSDKPTIIEGLTLPEGVTPAIRKDRFDSVNPDFELVVLEGGAEQKQVQFMDPKNRTSPYRGGDGGSGFCQAVFKTGNR